MVTIEQLRQIPLPAKTDTYIPVAHGDFTDAILEYAYKKNYNLRHMNFDANTGGQIMRGTFAFISDDPAMDFQVGIVNSYNKRKVAMVGVGTQVFICQNGMISADFTLKRKHTGSVIQDLNSMIEGSMEQLYDEFVRNIQVREALSNIELTKIQYAEIIGKMYLNEEVITPNQLAVVKQEYKESVLFPEPTAWSMYNHVNQALKKGHPADYIDSHVNLHKFMITEFN